MARTAGKDPGVMKTKKTPRHRQKKAKSRQGLGKGSGQEWAPRPNNAQPNGARKDKKSRAGGGSSGGSGSTGSGSTGGGAEVPSIDEGVQPPTTSAAATEPSASRKRKSTSEGGGGGRQRRRRATRNEAAAPAPAAAPTASSTSSTTSTTTTRGTRRTTSSGGSGSGGGGGDGGASGTSPLTSTAPPSTTQPTGIPVTREDIMSRIRDKLTPEQQARWGETTGSDSWAARQGRVDIDDVNRQNLISELKKRVTGRDVSKHAAGVGRVVFREGVLWDTLTCKILAFPVNLQHFMGGPEEWEGENAAVVWRNVVYWLGENGKLVDGQCCTAHYLGQVMQRCGLDRVFVCDASGVAHPRSGSALKKDHAGTRELVTEHVRYLLGSGRRILEVHSRGTTLRFLEVLEEMATAGHADVSFKIGSGNVRVHVFFGVPCGPDGELDTVVLFGTNHHSMMRWSFVANSIIRSQIAASALAGNPLTQEQIALLWLMSTTGTLTPEEWKEHFAELIEELGEELLAKFEEYIREHDGDMDRAYQSLNGWKGGMAAPTTKTKKGGEWETALRERREEVARLGAAPRTRGNAKAVGKVALDVDEISAKLEAQYRRWDFSVGAMQFGNALKYEEYLAAKKIVGDKKASPREVAEASAVVARLERDKKENLAANGRKGATAPLKPTTVAQSAYQRVVAAGQTPTRGGVNFTGPEKNRTKSTNELKGEGADTAWVKDGKLVSRDTSGAVKITSGGASLKGKADYAEGAALPGGGTSKGTRKRKAAGGEDGVLKGTEGGSSGGFLGLGKKNASFTLKHATRVRRGLDPGFTHARCSQGAGKECGRCTHIEEWDGLAIPDLRPGVAQDAWVAVLRSHAIRMRVPGGGNKVVTLHKGAMSPWEGDAATGQSLKDAEGVEYLSERRAAVIVAKHEDLYREWSKNNPDNN